MNLFEFDQSALLHTLIVGTLGYITIVLILRISGKRTLSKWNSFDFIVTVAFGSILATLVLSKDTSLIQGVLGFGLLVLLQYLVTWLSVRSSIVQKLIKAEPKLLVYRGEFQNHAMKQERIAKGEILATLRSNGVAKLEEVEAVVLETDGSFSVIKELSDGSASTLSDVKGYPNNTVQV